MKQNRRFIGALGSSSELWALNSQEYYAKLDVIIGDILISSVFSLYYRTLPKKYRKGIKT